MNRKKSTLTILLILSILSAGYMIWRNSQLNHQIDLQSEEISRQSALLDSLRGSNSGKTLNSLIISIDQHIKDAGDSTLNAQVIQRIAAFSRSLTPYYFDGGDSLSSSPVSPERGQLFISLMENYAALQLLRNSKKEKLGLS